MTRSLATFRRFGARWALLPSLLLLIGLVLSGVHNHARESSGHPCAICSLSSASATPVAAAVPVQGVEHVARVILEPAATPRSVGHAAPCCRAPPAA